MYTDKFGESLDFCTRVYGLKLSGRDDTSAYLRAWDDYEFSTLKLTKSDTTGIGHVAYRVYSPQALGRRVGAIEDSANQVHGWTGGAPGQCPPLRLGGTIGTQCGILWVQGNNKG